MVVTADMVGLVLIVLVLDFCLLTVASEWIDSPLHYVLVELLGVLLFVVWVVNQQDQQGQQAQHVV